jgi:CheY-like chemotaxis protein
MRAKELVQQILAFSRQSDYEKKPIRLASMVKEILKLIRASLPSNIEIRQAITADSSTILGDPIQIHQVLMNLCTNAGYAMRQKGGILEVTLSAIEYCRKDKKTGPYFKIEVSDTGHGMSGAVLEKIFDPFYTTKPKEEGTGLGLSVVHGIVMEHNGDIKVDSRPGRGTRFRVYLPQLPGSNTIVAAEKEPLPTGNEHILVVDDERPIANAVKQMLERLGYTVTAVFSSQEALDLFTDNPAGYDLLLTDQTMPIMTGDQLALKTLALRPDIPVVLCTGFSHVIDKARADEIGIHALISKPVVRRELAVAVRRALDAEQG